MIQRLPDPLPSRSSRASLDLLDYQGPGFVNSLQQLLADAMAQAGMPVDRRGSKAELSRRSGVEDAIISNIFNRPRYVPDDGVRQALCSTLGISRTTLDSAAAEIKGLRIYTTDPGADLPARIDDWHADFTASVGDLTSAQIAEIKAKLDEIEADLARQVKNRPRRKRRPNGP